MEIIDTIAIVTSPVSIGRECYSGLLFTIVNNLFPKYSIWVDISTHTWYIPKVNLGGKDKMEPSHLFLSQVKARIKYFTYEKGILNN